MNCDSPVKYHFIIINNNNDALHFHIEASSMKDYRLRFSAIKSQYKRFSKGIGQYKSVFTLFKGDYSYYRLEYRMCLPSEVPEIVKALSDERKERFKDSTPYVSSNIITFEKPDIQSLMKKKALT
jgi:hypothetical protein